MPHIAANAAQGRTERTAAIRLERVRTDRREIPSRPRQHAAPHRLRKLPEVLERRPRAVRRADEVDALGPERAPDRVEILHRDPGRVVAQPRCAGHVRQRLQTRPAAREPRDLTLGIGGIGERLAAHVGAVERSGAAGAALIDEDQIAALVEPAKQRRDRRRDRHRALPRPAREQEHRIGQLALRERRDDDEMDRDLRAARLARIERPLHRPAQHLVREPGHPARAQSLGARAGGRRRENPGERQRSDARPGRHRRGGPTRRGFA